MEPINDNEMVIVDEDGVETKVEILFTYENEDRGAQYVLYYDPSCPEEVYAAKYNDQHELIEIEDEEEWAEVEEVLNTYETDPAIQGELEDNEE